MSAAGKVCTGFSLPYVAKYACESGTISYTNGRKLARGVDVSIEPDSSDDNKFYADNQAAETDAGSFTGGTLNLTVDGLFVESESMIMGLPAAGTNDDWVVYDDDQEIPYVGFGCVARYQSDNEESFVPVVLTKVQFNQIQSSAATSEETKNFQTQSLTATILRGDDAKHSWKRIAAEDCETEAAAEALVKSALGIST